MKPKIYEPIMVATFDDPLPLLNILEECVTVRATEDVNFRILVFDCTKIRYSHIFKVENRF